LNLFYNDIFVTNVGILDYTEFERQIHDDCVGKIAVIKEALVKNNILKQTRTKIYVCESGFSYYLRIFFCKTHANARNGAVRESAVGKSRKTRI
jgi:hypothetical protein